MTENAKYQLEISIIRDLFEGPASREKSLQEKMSIYLRVTYLLLEIF